VSVLLEQGITLAGLPLPVPGHFWLPTSSSRGGKGTVNLFGRGQRGLTSLGQVRRAAYIVMATLLISAHTRNDRILAALCSAAVTRSQWRWNRL
jgi:hypothetical protein